jgi:hypothetical protein
MTVKQRNGLQELVINIWNNGYDRAHRYKDSDIETYDRFTKMIKQWIMKQQLI